MNGNITEWIFESQQYCVILNESTSCCWSLCEYITDSLLNIEVAQSCLDTVYFG